jgi:uncharacterized protein (TIGR02145 family)
MKFNYFKLITCSFVTAIALGLSGCASEGGGNDSTKVSTDDSLKIDTNFVDNSFEASSVGQESLITKTFKIDKHYATPEFTLGGLGILGSAILEQINISKNIYVMDANGSLHIRGFITSELNEVSPFNTALSLVGLMIPVYISDKSSLYALLEENFKTELDELSAEIINSNSLRDIRVIEKLSEVIHSIQNRASKVTKGFLSSDANWMQGTQNTHIPIKVVSVEDADNETQNIRLEVFNKYAHWREFYVVDSEGNKVEATSTAIAPNLSDKLFSTVSSTDALTLLSDLYRGITDSSFSLANEGILSSTKTTVLLNIPTNAKEIVITPESNYAKAFNIMSTILSSIDASGLDLGFADFFTDISSRREDVITLIDLWETDKEEAVNYVETLLKNYAVNKGLDIVISTLSKQLLAIPNTVSALSSNIVIANTATNTRVYTIPIPHEKEEVQEDIFVSETIMFKGLEYKTIQSETTGQIWLDRNLGATRACQSLDDEACYGDLYQWGRDADGHEKRNSSSFIIYSDEGFDTDNYDWIISDGDGSERSAFWSKTDGSGICPIGYRVPTIDELAEETLLNGVDDRVDASNNFLKLPSAGGRSGSVGSLGREGSGGYVWAATPGSSNALHLHFTSGYAYTGNGSRAYGCSVRCLKD